MRYEKIMAATGYEPTTAHTGKMKGLHSISTSPLCNGQCLKNAELENSICSNCYSFKMMKQYKALAGKMARNSERLCKPLAPAEIPENIKTPSGYFRFEAFGDVGTVTQAENYIKIATANPGIKFAAWTKNPKYYIKAVENIGKPKNLILIQSSLYINKPVKKAAACFDYTFTVYDKQFAKDNNTNITCGARSCANCGKCYTGTPNSENIAELLK